MFGRTIKSLVKSGVRDLKEKFSKDDGVDEFPTPFGLRIGAAVDIDTLPLRMHAGELHVDLPEATMIIVAQGYIDLGDGSYAHRYYNSDDANESTRIVSKFRLARNVFSYGISIAPIPRVYHLAVTQLAALDVFLLITNSC